MQSHAPLPTRDLLGNDSDNRVAVCLEVKAVMLGTN